MDTANQLHPQFITDESGKKTGVILSIKEYKELLEDLDDLAVAAERREESVVSHDDLTAELKRDGLIQD